MDSDLNEAILEATLDAIAILDLEGFLLFTNTALATLSGYSKEELVGQKLSKICTDSSFISNLMESTKENPRISKSKTTLMSKTSLLIPTDVSAGLIRNKERIYVVFHNLYDSESKISRKVIQDIIYITLLRVGVVGPEVVITEIPHFLDGFSEDILTLMGVYYATALGQGEDLNIGLYGPLPIPRISDYEALIYSFFIADPTHEDLRGEGDCFALISLSIPKSDMQLFSNRRRRIEDLVEQRIKELAAIQDIDLEMLKALKQQIISLVNL